ncbi:hypothetical protein B0T14DRAFT_431761 [Immersiella caudata]|uniref:Tat pathway signal sequence n=1 Tax=Immersiella caudata TaxID=314043 RepID=A0AA40C0U9_9PEZI|nr:hypothetical protein B0T14DRAFT_431761 [Immersiella caudata]
MFCSFVALSCLNIMGILYTVIIHTSISETEMNYDIKRTSSYSPIFDLVDMHLAPATFNGALRDNTSIWRMPPSPEVDAAWDRISAEDMQIVTVSAEDVRRSGKDPSICVKAPESWGLGNDAYIAQVEVFHQIHCLNELRKEMHPDYYQSSPPTELHLAHRAHCIHMLLQALMCSADVGIITHNWVHDERYSEPKTRAFPDFGANKMCRNFDAVMDWLREKGGIRDFASKFPMKHPPGAPVIQGEGYATSE